MPPTPNSAHYAIRFHTALQNIRNPAGPSIRQSARPSQSCPHDHHLRTNSQSSFQSIQKIQNSSGSSTNDELMMKTELHGKCQILNNLWKSRTLTPNTHTSESSRVSSGICFAGLISATR